MKIMRISVPFDQIPANSSHAIPIDLAYSTKSVLTSFRSLFSPLFLSMKSGILFSLAGAAALFFLVSCSKETQDDTPEVFRRRVAPALLPVPSCNDTTDDGKFETWNSSEDSLILFGRSKIFPAGTHVPRIASNIRIANRSIPTTAPVIHWSAQIDTSKRFSMAFDLVDQAMGAIVAYADRSIGGEKITYPSQQSFSTQLTANGSLTPGCKRLYYMGYLANGTDKSGTALSAVDSLIILYRGHFDVDVY